MAKNKKNSSQKNKHSNTQAAKDNKAAQNGTENRSFQQGQAQKSEPKNKVLISEHHKNKARPVETNVSSSMKLQLVVMLISVGVAVSGVVFWHQIQEVVENTLQIHLSLSEFHLMFGSENEAARSMQEMIMPEAETKESIVPSAPASDDHIEDSELDLKVDEVKLPESGPTLPIDKKEKNDIGKQEKEDLSRNKRDFETKQSTASSKIDNFDDYEDGRMHAVNENVDAVNDYKDGEKRTVAEDIGNKVVSQSKQSDDTKASAENESVQRTQIDNEVDRKLENDNTNDKKHGDEKNDVSSIPDRGTYTKSNITNDEDFRIHEELDEADELLDKENLEKAIEKYDEILRKHITSPRAHYGKGLTLDKLGFKYMSNENLEQAIDFLARILQLPSVPDELLKLAGRKLADRQQFRGWGGQAVKTFKTLIQRFPEDLKLKNELGVSYMMIGHNDRARDVYKEVLARDSKNGFAKAHLGFILKTQDNDLEKAVELLTEGIQSQEPGTSDGRFYLQLGDSLLRLSREEEARKFFQEGADRGLFLSAWQRSLYNVDRLTGRPWWTPAQTPYQAHLKLLQDNWKVIRDEGLAQLNAKTGSFVTEDENLRDTGDWKQFTLYQQGRKKTENCAKAPKTCQLIDQIPDAKGCKRGQVKFSVMSPGIHVWPHVGPTNCRIRAHLGLVVPEGPVIRVMKETRTWKEGEFIIFDDSFEHEVWHEGSELRLVLIVDFWHPELTESEKRRLSAI